MDTLPKQPTAPKSNRWLVLALTLNGIGLLALSAVLFRNTSRPRPDAAAVPQAIQQTATPGVAAVHDEQSVHDPVRSGGEVNSQLSTAPKPQVDFYPTPSTPSKPPKQRYDDIHSLVERAKRKGNSVEDLAKDLMNVNYLYYRTGQSPSFGDTKSEIDVTARKLFEQYEPEPSETSEYGIAIKRYQSELDIQIIEKRNRVNFRDPDIINR